MPSREYYDPVKAREYYLRTRELKGRDKASGNSSKEKKKAKQADEKAQETAAKRQVSDAVNAEKKIELEKLRQQNEAVTTRLRGIATMKRVAIQERLKQFMEQVSEANANKRETIAEQNQKRREEIAKDRKAKAEKLAADRKAEAEKIVAEANRKIEALPDMPKNLDRFGQKKWRERRAQEVAGIRGEANSAQEKLSDKTTTEIDKINEDSQAEREKANEDTQKLRTALNEGTTKVRGAAKEDASGQKTMVAAELKTSLGQARDNYGKQRTALVEKYKSIQERERTKLSS